MSSPRDIEAALATVPRPIAMLALALVAAVPLQAQTNLDEESGLQFNFIPPGARSLALGGAFSGLADDATAAVANPAGLIQLSEPEVSIELRRWDYTNTYFSGGEYVLPGGNTTLPTNDELPVTRGLQSTESSTEDVSFLSYVYPKERFAVAIYRTQVTDFESRIDPDPILIRIDDCSRQVYGSPAPMPTTPNTPPFARQCNFTGGGTGFLELDISSIGIAGAFKFTKTLALGFTMATFDYQQTILSGDEAEGDATKSVRGDDTAVASSVGLLWKPRGFESGKLSVGFVYRQGPEFNGVAEVRCNAIERIGRNGQPETVVLPERACAAQGVGDGEILRAGLENNPIGGVTTFKVPDTWSLGVSARPNDRWMFTFEYDRVEYSDLVDEVTNTLVTASVPGAFVIDDADEFHLGAEYNRPLSKVSERLLYLRVGAWHDPDHRLRVSEINDNRRLEARFGTQADGEDDLHLTGGIGLAFRTFQIDAAADFSDVVDTFSLSGVFRF